MNKSELGRAYRSAVALQKRMDSLTDLDEQFQIQFKLNLVLNSILKENFLLLDKKPLLHFLCMCSSHRPVEPFSVLTAVSVRFKETFNESAQT